MFPQQLEKEIAKLPTGERAALAKRLIDGLDGCSADDSDEEIEKQWIEVAENRLRALESNQAQEIPLDEAMQHAHDLIS